MAWARGRSASTSPWSFQLRIAVRTGPSYRAHAQTRPVANPGRGRHCGPENRSVHAGHSTSSAAPHPAHPRGIRTSETSCTSARTTAAV